MSFNLDSYDGVGLDITEKEVNTPPILHRFVTNIFLDSQGFYKNGLNIALFKEYGLDEEADLAAVISKLQSKLSIYKEIPFNKKLWVYFWLCTIGAESLLKYMQRIFLTDDMTQIAYSLKQETHPSRDRWLAIVIYLNFMDEPPRNDKFLVGMKIMQFHTKTMFYLNSFEIPKKYITENTLIENLITENGPEEK